MSYIGSTPTTQSFIAGTDYFNGTGSAVSFTLSRSVNSVNDIEVIVNNVEQIPSGYSVSGTTLTFSAAPSAGTSNVYVRYLSTTNLSLAIPAGTSATFNTVTATSLTATTLGATNFSYTGTLTGGTGVVNLGSGQVYKDASGNVGIGTASPASKLDVVNGSIRVNEDGAGTKVLTIRSNWAGVDPAINVTTNNSLLLMTNNTERARIDSSGNLLFGGRTDLLTTLSGGTVLQGANNNLFVNRRDTTASASQFIFRNPNGEVGIISTSGSATTYATSSDYRLKEAIAPMTGALAKVALLKPCTYKWKVDGSDGQGFIAHELDEVVSGCVTGAKDAVDAEGKPQYQGIDTSFLVATLTAAIQEQQALITALTTRITALENNNATQ